MKKLILALAAALALCAPADTVKFATRDWVIKQFAAHGIRISTATVSHDETNGTFTVSGPFTSSSLPNCSQISLTFSEPTLPTPALRKAALRATRGVDNSITVTLTTGTWTDLDGDPHPFDFGPSGITLTWPEELPEIPSSEHVCELDSNCVCIYDAATVYDIEIPAEYDYLTPYAAQQAGLFDILSWIDADSWPEEDVDTVGGSTIYFVEDAQGRRLNIEDLVFSDVWFDVVQKYNDRLAECRQAYIQAHICDQDNPQHRWSSFSCGPYSWKICANNSSHKQGTEQHDWHETAKVAKAGNTGWTKRRYCTGGHADFRFDHDCKHVNCAACSAGDDCNWPCPTCNGHHDFPYVATGDRCARCGCDGCGQTESAALGTKTEGLHAGWHCCGYKDGDDDLSNGDHCECECGDFHHAEDSHDRDVKDPPEYRQIEGNDDRHYIINMTECKRCQDPYGILEGHTWLSDETGAPGYKWLSNEKCAEKDTCKDCGYEKVQSADEAGGHEPDGDPMSYGNIDAATCRRWYICLNCEGVYYDDEHGHSLGAEPVRHENVSSEICRAVFDCEHDCGYEEEDDTGGHTEGEAIGYEYVSDSVCRMKWLCANGCGYEGGTDTAHVRGADCICENCRTYEFEHSFKPDDPCGNESCEFCGEPKPNTNPTHSGWTSNGPGGHTCACGHVTEGHAMAQTAFSQSDTGWTITLTCSKCGFVDTRSHTHHFTNCGTCDAGDNCTVPCTGCKGNHKFGTRTNYSCAHCECPTCTDCDVRPADMSLHIGWAPCSEDVEADNYDGTASGGHCQCACLFYGHNAGTGHDYQRVSGESEYTPYDEQNHFRLVGQCSRCGKLRKEKEPHSIPSEPIRYGTGSEEHCPAIFKCSQCEYELELDYGGHEFDGGDTSIETSGGVTHIITTYTCIRCGYSYDDESELACYHEEVILENGEPVGFGASLWHDCVCSNCNTNRNHSFGGTPINEPGRCAMLRCQNENGDGSLCSATTNTIQGTHVGWSYIDDSLHECACTLRRDGHAIEFVTNTTYACVIDEICGGNSATNGCGHIFGSTHNADLVYCGPNAFCSICKRKRTIGEDGETVWVAGDGTDHCWDGKPEAERTKCKCDCELVVSHYYAPDRADCSCECGDPAGFKHDIPGDPYCYCTGSPSHTKVLISHGTPSPSINISTNHCNACGKNWTDKTTTLTCTVCDEKIRDVVERGTHVCKGGYETTAGTITLSWEAYQIGYDWEEEEPEQVAAGSKTDSWSGGGGGGMDAWAGSSSLSASGATIAISQSGYYKLTATIDDSGTVSVGGLTAMEGPRWDKPGDPVYGWLDEGPVSVSASVESGEGPIQFGYSLEYIGTSMP